MKKAQNIAAGLFVFCVWILTLISIFGIWEVFDGDVIAKSFQTLGLLAGVALIVIIAGKFADKDETVVDPALPPAPNNFTQIRHVTIVVLIVSVVLLALIGVLAIWDVLAGETLNKSVASMATLAFGALVTVMTCLEREKHKILTKRVSGGSIILIVVFGWLLLSSIF
jgi:hypothetical protein